MTEFGIVVLVVLLIAVLFYLKKRTAGSSCCSSKETHKSEPNVPEPRTQQPETESVEKPVINAELTSVNPQVTDTTVVAPPESLPENKPTNIKTSVKPQAKKATVSTPENTSGSLLPQDSILKRHYLNHVCMMVETLAPPRPTDSVLCRHYDAMIIADIDQCINNKIAMEQLVHNYENKK